MDKTAKQLRILWNSNSSWATSGYSNQSGEILPLIRDEGFPIAASNFFGQSGGKFMLDGILQYPVINHAYGSDAMVLHGRDFKADIVISLQDSWVLHPNDLQQVNRYIPWLPVDHDPIPPAVLDKLKFAYRIIAMTKFGQKQLQSKGLYSTYIPHTVNTEVFKPLDKIERKKAAGLPDNTYVVGMVGANKDNPPRKSFQEALDAFKMFLEKVPNAVFYIHTNPDFPGGFPVKEYANIIGVADKVLFPDNYEMNFNLGKEQMSLVYNTFDMLIAPSVSEGFCIPVIEAQSCGVPVVVNNWTNLPELIIPGETGEVCDLVAGANGKRFSAMGSYAGIPSTQSLFESMMKIYRADTGKMRKACRKWIEDNYDTKKIFTEKWAPFLSRIEKEIYKV